MFAEFREEREKRHLGIMALKQVIVTACKIIVVNKLFCQSQL